MRPIPALPRVLSLLAVLGCVLVPLSARAAGNASVADTRRLLALLAGIAGEYHEAFDAQGRLTRPIEVEEAKLLLAEARDLNTRLAVVPPAQLDALEGELGGGAAVETFGGSVQGIAAAVTERRGRT